MFSAVINVGDEWAAGTDDVLIGGPFTLFWATEAAFVAMLSLGVAVEGLSSSRHVMELLSSVFTLLDSSWRSSSESNTGISVEAVK